MIYDTLHDAMSNITGDMHNGCILEDAELPSLLLEIKGEDHCQHFATLAPPVT